MEDNLNEILKLAKEKGAINSKLLSPDKIVVAEWVSWKCRFGCPSYGKFFMCPPHAPTPEQTRALLKDYDSALLLQYTSTQDYHNLLLDLERESFLRGFYKALGLSAGSCRLCDMCNISNGSCMNPVKARPSMEACGIDVFGTARKAGLELEVLTSNNDIYPRICLLLLK